MEDEVLSGGVAHAGLVVRRGNEVLRPAKSNEEHIAGLLRRLRSEGFDRAPWPLGVGDDGRARFEYISGDVVEPPFPAWVQTDSVLMSIARLLRRFHDASSRCGVEGDWSDELNDPAGGSVLCHNDVCLENIVFRDCVAVAFLDFDFVAPGRPIFDVAQCLRMCDPIDAEVMLHDWAGPRRIA